jgi:threonine/homoserine/homoserine lactone efflux protein
MFEAILRGLILGLGLSFTTGTTFVILFNIALHRGLKAAIWFVLGVFISDAIIFAIVFFGFAKFYLNPQFQNYFSLIGGLLIIIYGINLLFGQSLPQISKQEEKLFWSFILRGFSLNFFNPMVFIFWLSISTFVSQRATPLLIASVALVSMLATDMLKAYFISKFRQSIKSQFIKWFNVVSAVVLIIIGLNLLIRNY